MMIRRAHMIGVAAAAALLQVGPALAQTEAGTQELHIYGGQLFGDDLTDREVSGRTPELDDDVTYGLRYGYNLSDTWGIEVSLGRTQSTALLPGRDIDLDLTTLDLDAVWNFNNRSRFTPYLLAGVGYASADLDAPIRGTVNGQQVTINDDENFTLNAGIGAKYFAANNVVVRLEARYRYLDGVVDRLDDSLNTVETTLGVGWRF